MELFAWALVLLLGCCYVIADARPDRWLRPPDPPDPPDPPIAT